MNLNLVSDPRVSFYPLSSLLERRENRYVVTVQCTHPRNGSLFEDSATAESQRPNTRTRPPAIGRARLDSSLAAPHAHGLTQSSTSRRREAPRWRGEGAQQSCLASLQIPKALARGAMAERLAASLLPAASPSPSARRATVAAAAAASFPSPCSARAGLRLRSRPPLFSQVPF